MIFNLNIDKKKYIEKSDSNWSFKYNKHADVLLSYCEGRSNKKRMIKMTIYIVKKIKK